MIKFLIVFLYCCSVFFAVGFGSITGSDKFGLRVMGIITLVFFVIATLTLILS